MRDVLAGGDHVIVTGEVEAIAQREGEPLVFADGGYVRLPDPEAAPPPRPAAGPRAARGRR